MDRPMRLHALTVFDRALASALTYFGAAVLAWAVAATLARRALLPASSLAAGVLIGFGGVGALLFVVGAGGVRRYSSVIRLGILLTGAVGSGLLVGGILDARAGAIASGVALLGGDIFIGRIRGAALRSGYRPVWFSSLSFPTMVAAVETMIDGGGREAIPPERAAANTDRLLAAIDAPVLGQIRLLFFALEWFLPLLTVGRPLRFTTLDNDSRRQVIERLIVPHGPLAKIVLKPFRTVARTLKALTCAGYYGDPVTMRAIGFVEYEGSLRSIGVDLTPRTYPDPFLPATGMPPSRAGTSRIGPGASESFDAIVIGSGAAGSVMAHQLACKGLSVVVLERGRHEDPQTFEHSELEMFPRLYKDGGLQTAADRNTAIFQGRTVGGSTVINNAIWLRPPELTQVLESWRQGGAYVPEARLIAAFEELEQALHVGPIDRTVANPGTGLFLAGARPTGVVLENNRDTCVGCGWCNYGCRYNRKTSMLVTYIPWAQERGVAFCDQVSNTRIAHDGRRAIGVDGELPYPDGRPGTRKVRWRGDKVIVCAGAIGSSELLLQSRITARGRVGQGLHVLGGLFVTGDMGQVVDGFAGIGLTCMEDANRHYVLESYFAPPLAFSVRVGGWLRSHFDRVERYRHFIDGGVLVGTDPACGSVSLKRGNASINLTPSCRDIENLKAGLKRMASIYFNAGARRVYPSTFKYIDLTRETYPEVIEKQIQTIDDVLFGSAHPQGGNVMNRWSGKGVVDEHFLVHGFENLYVADTSVWPSNIWANCQATAMAMAHYAADEVLT